MALLVEAALDALEQDRAPPGGDAPEVPGRPPPGGDRRVVRFRALLEAALREDRHVDSGDGAHARANNVGLQRVEALDAAVQQLLERDGERGGNHGAAGVGAEGAEAEALRRRIGADVGAR